MNKDCVIVSEIPGKGRGLVAARDIAGGETVLRDTPLLLVVDEQAKSYCCSHCFRIPRSTQVKQEDEESQPQYTSAQDTSSSSEVTGQLPEEPETADTIDDVSFVDLGEPFQLRCEGCSEVWYCRNECKQAASRLSHSPFVCGVLSRLRRSKLESEERNQAWFLAAAFNLKAACHATHRENMTPESGSIDTGSSSSSQIDQANPSPCPPHPFEALLQLDGVPSSSDDTSEALFTFLEGAITATGMSIEGFDRETVALLLCKDQRNSYGIMAPNGPEGERRLRASGVYPRAALINHNCLPNVTRFDYFDKPGVRNTSVSLRALHNISAGSEICQSYFPVTWPYELRQERLLEEYGFTCDCERCQVEQAWSEGEDSEAEYWDEGEEEGVASEAELVVVGTASSKGKEKVVEGTERKETNLGGAGVLSDEDESGKRGPPRKEGGSLEDDFHHAMFFVQYLCPDEDCGGTMAPLEGRWTGDWPGVGDYESAEAMECNMCGRVRTDAEFQEELSCHQEEHISELS